MAKLLRISHKAVKVYLLAEGNSIQVILAVPFDSALHLAQLWRREKEEVKWHYLLKFANKNCLLHTSCRPKKSTL